MNYYNKLLFIIPIIIFIPQLCFSTIVADKDEYIFDKTTRGDIVSGSFIITNNGNSEKHITFHTSCDCLFLGSEEADLDPLEEYTLFWDFSTKEYNSSISVVIIVATEGEDNLYLTISGNTNNKAENLQHAIIKSGLIILGLVVVIILCVILILRHRKMKNTA